MSNLAVAWQSLPRWVQLAGLFVGGMVAVTVVKALHRRAEWKHQVEAAVYLGALLLINARWGVPGLLIVTAFGGGVLGLYAIDRADKADARRRSRLLRALQKYLQAQHERFYGHLRYDEKKGWKEYTEYIKETYEVYGDYQLLRRFDEEGWTAEDLQAMTAESKANAAAEQARRLEERAQDEARKSRKADGGS